MGRGVQQSRECAGWRPANAGNREAFEKALAAYGDALKERTRERSAFDWARAENNRGLTLVCLGLGESTTARLDEAVTVFAEVLQVWTREGAASLWSVCSGNQGVARLYIAERRSDIDMARTALTQIEDAAAIARTNGNAQNADFLDAKLAQARELVAALEKKP